MTDFLDMVDEDRSAKVKKRPWMDHCLLKRVTVETLDMVMQECIDSGIYALDLETTGLDTRVFERVTKTRTIKETVDTIVGVCLSPDGVRGYYIPLRHKNSDANIPMSKFRPAFDKLIKSPARAIFHNGKFDQEFLQFNGGQPWGWWDDPSSWEDTLILAYLMDTRRKTKGLKVLSKEFLDIEQIELKELFPDNHRGGFDFSNLDPAWEPVTWYAAGDAIATFRLWKYLHPLVVKPKNGLCQSGVYAIEKGCIAATRWMERNRIHINRDLVGELICIGQKEYIDSIHEVYQEVSSQLGRDVMPNFFHLFQEEKITDDPNNPVNDQIDKAKQIAKDTHPDIAELVTRKIGSDNKTFPWVYDIRSPPQIGLLFEELEVPGLTYTEKSGQVKTSKDALDKVVESAGAEYNYMNKVKRFREVQKALSTYLFPLYEDCEKTDHTLRIHFNGTKVDTGRFSTGGAKDRGFGLSGGTRYNLQSTPAGYDENRPECMKRIRECFIAPPGKMFAACDYSGMELRIITNMSQEPKWLEAFFQCSDCDQVFDKSKAPPKFCLRCGSDQVGDLHSLSAYTFYGKESKGRENWKQLRQNAKFTNFGLCYGGGANAVKNQINCTESEAWRIKKAFDSTYSGLTHWWDSQHKYAREHECVYTAFKRKYPLPDINHENSFFASKAERNATNGLVQGTGADITKVSMYFIYKECKERGWLDKVQMVITMHDELCFLIDHDVLEEALEMIEKQMTDNKAIRRLKWKIPLTLDIEIGTDWTVPWSVSKYQHGKKPWPEELKPYFKAAQVDPANADAEAPTQKEVTPPKETPYYQMEGDLNPRGIKVLLYIIEQTADPDGEIVQLKSLGRVPLDTKCAVNRDQFLRLARELGL